MNPLEECHRKLGRLLGPDAEPIEVLRCAEEHRAYWRPNPVRIILLAESHVFTAPSELDRRVILPRTAGDDIPRGFVRLVYCLGYGENELLNRHIPANPGTPQFWKIFYSCAHQIRTNVDFAPVLKSQTPLPERLRNKIALLRELKEMGVWLLDASVAALYLPGRSKPDHRLMESCIQTSWDNYVGQVVRDAEPSQLVCIGYGVRGWLGSRLAALSIPSTFLPQPNARLSIGELSRTFQTYHNVVQQGLRSS